MSIRRVFLATCDLCGTTVEVPEASKGSASHPPHWEVVSVGVSPDGSGATVCSVTCAVAWVEKHWPAHADPAPSAGGRA